MFYFLFIIITIWLCFSSYGQNLDTTTFIGETSFAIVIAILGLVLFAHLIGNMQVFVDNLYLMFLSKLYESVITSIVYNFIYDYILLITSIFIPFHSCFFY
jgi:hypothetical protein